MDQIGYLEKLLEGYRERYKRGEKDLLARIQATAAQLDELKLMKAYEKPAPPVKEAPRLLRASRCCKGR